MNREVLGYPSLRRMVPLPRLRDVPASFSVADSTGNEAEHVSQRHTHTEDADVARHTATDKALPSTYIGLKQNISIDSHVPFLLFSW